MREYIGHISRIIRAYKHGDKAISAGQEIKAEIEFSGGLEKVEECEKSAYDSGW